MLFTTRGSPVPTATPTVIPDPSPSPVNDTTTQGEFDPALARHGNLAAAEETTTLASQVGSLLARFEQGAASWISERTWICPTCEYVLRVSGGGRHRVYFELTDELADDPVMDRACPRCGYGLPGKNPPFSKV